MMLISVEMKVINGRMVFSIVLMVLCLVWNSIVIIEFMFILIFVSRLLFCLVIFLLVL